MVNLKLPDGTFVTDDMEFNVALSNYLMSQAPFTNLGLSTDDAILYQDLIGELQCSMVQVIASFIKYETAENGGVDPAKSDWSLGYNVEIEDPVTSEDSGSTVDSSGDSSSTNSTTSTSTTTTTTSNVKTGDASTSICLITLIAATACSINLKRRRTREK